MRLQKSSSLFVIFKLLLMLAAIQFDYYLLFDAGEIGNIFSYRVLATKPVAIKLLASYCLP